MNLKIIESRGRRPRLSFKEEKKRSRPCKYNTRYPFALLDVCPTITLRLPDNLLTNKGKSISIQTPRRTAVNRPLSVSKQAGWSGSYRPLFHSLWALARVACPHNLTSFSGVNQRSPNAGRSGARKAVSECFISAAMASSLVQQAYRGRVASMLLAGKGIYQIKVILHRAI